MTGKNSFMMHMDRLASLDEISDEDAGKLFKAIKKYVETGEMPPKCTLISIIFSPIKVAIDFDNEKYIAICEKRANSGKMGGLAKTSKSKQNLAKASKSKQNLAKPSYIDIDVDVDVDVEFEKNVVVVANNGNSATTTTLENSTEIPSLGQVEEYIKSQSFGFKAKYFRDYYLARGWQLGGTKISNWKALANNWQAIEVKNKSSGNEIFNIEELNHKLMTLNPEDI